MDLLPCMLAIPSARSLEELHFCYISSSFPFLKQSTFTVLVTFPSSNPGVLAFGGIEQSGHTGVL
jgi:hypothetical protein